MLVDDLARLLIGQGAALVGYADLAAIPVEDRQQLPRGVAIAVALDPAIVAGILGGPTLAYAAEYERANDLLDGLAEVAAAWLTEGGARAIACRATADDPGPTLTMPLPHKTVATRAGLGWVGRTGLLVTSQYGSAIRLTTVLTDAELATAQPVDSSRCGVCGLCVTACPSGAATGAEWVAGAERASLLDVRKCLVTCVGNRDRLGIAHTLCGVCVAVCPWTRRYLDGRGWGVVEDS